MRHVTESSAVERAAESTELFPKDYTGIRVYADHAVCFKLPPSPIALVFEAQRILNVGDGPVY